MSDLIAPVSATQAQTRMTMNVTAAYNATGDSISVTSATERLEIINIRSAQWPVEYRIGSGSWQVVQEGKTGFLTADLSTQTVKIRRGLDAPPTMVVDLVIYAKPVGLNAGQDAAVAILSPTKVAALDALVSDAGVIATRARAAARLVGGTTTSAGATNNATHHIKLEAEAPFSAVRFKILGRDTAASLTWKAAVASTATASQGSTALMFDPTVDGSTFITTLAASGNPNGWRAVTWGGAATTDVAAGASMLPGESPWSDWTPARSLTRVDGGTRPLLMLRIYHDGTSQPFTWVSGGFQTTQWLTQSAKNYFRVYQASHQNASDNVGTLTGKPGSLVGNSPWIVVEFAYDVLRARSVIGIGDSTMEANGTQLPANTYGAWGMRGCALASTVDRPISWVNCGYSSQNSTTYLAAGLAAIASHDPTDVLYAAGSPNDGTAEQFLSDAMMARTMRVLDVCRTGQRRLLLATMVPNETWSLAADNERKRYNALVRNMCSAGAATLVDYGAAIGNGASPELFAAGMKFDNAHPSDAAQDIGGGLLSDALLATW